MTTTAQPTIHVRQYRPEDHATVTKIYIEGLMAADPDPKYRFLWHELVRKDLTNDLADIEGSHMAPGGNFWVATATQDGSSQVVGIIGLLRVSDDVGQIRRVFVDPNFQRMSIGRKMILELENWAKQHGIKSLFLTTNANNPKPQAFYASLGYTKVDENEYDWKEHQYFRVFKFIKQL
ncbi:N-acetylaspartate synthetase [Phytophthora citrophthora]|uniref:N-acetylaspartate synthetase n=1 Tax=Phytophthora citrophthora TaxID=4793 RepID=A0AAD9GU95_9STRA|nr:N-acetylaspartate synthetase [Phytophthora citrophthora]